MPAAPPPEGRRPLGVALRGLRRSRRLRPPRFPVRAQVGEAIDLSLDMLLSVYPSIIKCTCNSPHSVMVRSSGRARSSPPLSIHLSVCTSTYLPRYLSTCLSFYLSIYPSIDTYLSNLAGYLASPSFDPSTHSLCLDSSTERSDYLST